MSTQRGIRAAAQRPIGMSWRPAAVILDMDGLMLDTEPLAARAWIDAAGALGVAFDEALTHRLIGRSSPDCQRLIREHHGEHYPVEALMRHWGAAYEAIIAREGIVVKAGLLELLEWLEARDIAKAVATSTRRSRARAKLTRCGLISRFASLVCGDEVASGKPAPDIFLAAAARLGASPERCVVLEDSEPGVRAALAGGMLPIMVPDLAQPSPELLACDLMVLPSLHAVRRHFETIERAATACG